MTIFGGINLRQNVDGSLGFQQGDGADIAKVGGAAPTQGVPRFRIPFALELQVLGTADTAGALFAVANNFGSSLFITKTLLIVTTQSAGACTVSIGCAANATTLNATLLSGQTVAAAGIFGGGLVANWQEWTTGKFLTGSTASGASSGLVGRVLVEGYI